MSVVPIKSLYNHLLAWLGRNPMPTFLSIEPSSVCQLHCPQCPCGKRGGELRSDAFMSLSTFNKILHDAKGWVHTFQFYFQGEPLLNPHLSEMIRLAHEAHIYTICSTNALALTPLLARQLVEAGLDRMVVSIDGLSENSYQTYRRGGSLNKALQGLVFLRQAKQQTGSRMHIELQCLRLKSNEHEWKMFRRSYRQMGADSLSLKTAQFYDYEQGNALFPTDSRYSRYCRMDDGMYRPKNRMKSLKNKPCRRVSLGCVITVNGDVLPCCFDKTSRYRMGNILLTELDQIWKGSAFQTFRQQVTHNRMEYAMCGNCTEN